MSTFNDPSTYGAFAPTTNVWDVNEILTLENIDPKLKELLVRLYQNLNLMSILLNIKDSGFYDLQEFVNGQLWFPNQTTPVTTFDTATALYRQNFRTVVNFGALPNAGTKPVPHNIFVTAMTIWTRIYGAATDSAALFGIPLPYVSTTAGDSIELDITSTSVSITTAANYSAYTAVIVIEYLQS